MTHPKLVETMMRPEFYPHRPERVELIQTHISFIFIAGDLVYKVKKAVDFGFLDFTTLEKRRFYCSEELRLNRRLAPEVYLDVAEIFDDGRGGLALGAGRGIVEYAVRMKKLPLDRMLKKLIQEGSVGPSIMEAIAQKLADFHGRAETGGRIDEIGGIETVRRNHEENFEQTGKYVGLTLPERRYRFIRNYVRLFLKTRESLFRKRVADHKIRDCHGDLHLEHICVADGIIIFDCIEFNERFRFEDVAAEVAFLAMDLDYNGYPEYGNAFVRAYIRSSGDAELGTLMNFYKCYYAYVRGKVTSFRIDDSAIGEEDRKAAAATAGKYFDLAYRYAAQLERPTLIIMAGLMGTGKSLLARKLAPLLGAGVIRTDVLRKEMLSLAPSERHYEAFGEGIYSEETSSRTYARALELARERLKAGGSVIIDASFRKREERLAACRAAAETGAEFLVIECVCSEDTIHRRLETRVDEKTEASDGRWEIFAAQKMNYDPVNEFPEERHIVVDTSGPSEESLSEAVDQIRTVKGNG